MSSGFDDRLWFSNLKIESKPERSRILSCRTKATNGFSMELSLILPRVEKKGSTKSGKSSSVCRHSSMIFFFNFSPNVSNL